MGDVKAIHPTTQSERRPFRRIDGVRIGKIVQVDERGEVRVDFPENESGPIIARLTSSAQERLRQVAPAGRDVLLVFDDCDPERPVIIDTLHPPLEDISGRSGKVAAARRQDEVAMDGKRITFDAGEEIVLRCGDASITLTKAGKILLKGSYLVSRSSGANRIKGASVQID